MIIETSIGIIIPVVVGLAYKASDLSTRVAVVEARVTDQQDDIKYIRDKVDKILEEMRK